MTIKPLFKRIILRPIYQEYQGTIAVPERYRKLKAACSVIARGTTCSPVLQPGLTVFCESEDGNRHKPINREGDFFALESSIIGYSLNGRIIPIGDWILFERDRSEKLSADGIILSLSTQEFQSISGWIRGYGLTYGKARKIDLPLGTYCQLVSRNHHMKEFAYKGQAYCLVKPSDLAFEWTHKSDLSA